MNCEISNEYMMKYFDGNINDIENAQLKQHLKTCVKCSSEFKGMEEIFGILEINDMVEPPEDFVNCVMSQVNTIELERKKKSERAVAFLYSASTIILIVLSLVMVTALKEINIPDMISSAVHSFDSFSGVLTAFQTIGERLVYLVRDVVVAFFEIAMVIVKAYYYIFIALMVLVLMGQKMFQNIVEHNKGGTK